MDDKELIREIAVMIGVAFGAAPAKALAERVLRVVRESIVEEALRPVSLMEWSNGCPISVEDVQTATDGADIVNHIFAKRRARLSPVQEPSKQERVEAILRKHGLKQRVPFWTLIEDVARLEAELAEAKAGWDSCIADLREAAEICKGVERQRDEARAQVADPPAQTGGSQ